MAITQYTPEEANLARISRANGLTREQFETIILPKYEAGQIDSKGQYVNRSLLQRAGSELKELPGDIKDQYVGASESLRRKMAAREQARKEGKVSVSGLSFSEPLYRMAENISGLSLPRPLEIAGAGAEFFTGSTGEVIEGGFSTAVSDPLKRDLGEGVGKAVQSAEPLITPISQGIGRFQASQPGLASDVGSIGNIGLAALEVAGLGQIGKVGGAAKTFTGNTIRKVPGALDNIKGIKLPSRKPSAIVAKRQDELKAVSDATQKMRNATRQAKAKGFNPIDDISKNDGFVPNVTGEGIVKSEKAIMNVDDFIAPYAKAISEHITKSGKMVNLKDFKKRAFAQLEEFKLTGSDYKKMKNRIARDFKVYDDLADEAGNVPVGVIDDIKKAKYKISNYANEKAQIADKIVGRSAREIIEETIDDVNVKALNNELARYYTVREYLTSLDGTRLRGGRLGKYFSTLVGAGVGSQGGAIGTLVGAQAGNKIQSLLLKTKLGGSSGKKIPSVSEGLRKVKLESSAQKGINKAKVSRQTAASQLGKELPQSMQEVGKPIAKKVPPTRLPKKVDPLETSKLVKDSNTITKTPKVNISTGIKINNAAEAIPKNIAKKIKEVRNVDDLMKILSDSEIKILAGIIEKQFGKTLKRVLSAEVLVLLQNKLNK